MLCWCIMGSSQLGCWVQWERHSVWSTGRRAVIRRQEVQPMIFLPNSKDVGRSCALSIADTLTTHCTLSIVLQYSWSNSSSSIRPMSCDAMELLLDSDKRVLGNIECLGHLRRNSAHGNLNDRIHLLPRRNQMVLKTIDLILQADYVLQNCLRVVVDCDEDILWCEIGAGRLCNSRIS